MHVTPHSPLAAMNRIIALLLLSTLHDVQVRTEDAKCGYNACARLDPSKLNIHIVAHSHDDVGWLQTANDYYENSVKHVITNVAQQLDGHPQRKFTQVEQYYFHRWWTEANETMRAKVHKLVQNGQFVFIGGGWVVNDEPVTHYNNVIDQMTLGHKFLHETFGQCGLAKVSWQVDTFGHSNEMASLLAQMNYDGHITNRAVNPKGQFLWRGSSNDLGDKSEIMVSNLHNHYHAPDGFDFESDKNQLHDNDIDQRADKFLELARQWNKDYGNLNQVLMTMGADFYFVNAHNWYTNIDKLIDNINRRHKDVHALYSTPNCYFHALNQLNKTFEVRDHDYLHFWSGFYTTRPTIKDGDRRSNNHLQAAKQLTVLTGLDYTHSNLYLSEASNEVAILQHHDAITGTSPQGTADDYVQRIYNGLRSNYPLLTRAFERVNQVPLGDQMQFCETLNISQCAYTEKEDNFAVHLYNPLGHFVSEYVRIPVRPNTLYKVRDAEKRDVHSSQVPIPEHVLKSFPQSGRTPKDHVTELVFKVNLGALEAKTYFVNKEHGSIREF